MSRRSHLLGYFLPGSFHTEEFSVISSWLIRLRWAAVCGFLLLSALIFYFSPSFLPAGQLFTVCLLILLYNVAFAFFSKVAVRAAFGALLFFTRLQVFLDWIALLALIHFTGGMFSPLIFFFILHIIINSFIFPPKDCFIYTTLSLIGLAALFLLEYYLNWFPVPVSWLGTQYRDTNLITIFFAFAVYAFILLTATFLASSIMVRFRQRENDVRHLSNRVKESLSRMETLYEATQAMVTSFDIKTILDIIVKESTHIMKAKGAILRLVQAGHEELVTSASFGLSAMFLEKGPVTRGAGIFPKTPDEIITVEDVKTDARIVYREEGIKEGIGSIISIPLPYKGAVIGDLRLYCGKPRVYSSDEISFLLVLAGGAATVIENARAWEKLEDAYKQNVFLAHKMSHDLRAPVVAVQSLLAAMKEGYAGEITPKQQEILDRCINKQGQLLLIIRDVLELAEGQSTVGDRQLVTVFIDKIAGDSIKLLEMLFDKKNIGVKYVPPDTPISFREVQGDFQRLFSNLLENALRYTPEGGRVECALSRDGENIHIRIADTGIGIEHDDLGKIFNEFHRSPRAKKYVKDGTGLGLPTVKSIVTRYNGFIKVESRPDEGTAVSITIPNRQ